MKLKHVIIIGLSFIPLLGYSQLETFTIKGKINPKHDGKFVKLFYEGGQAEKADSVLVKKGAFTFTGTVSAPTVGNLSFGNKEEGDRIDLFLSEGTVRVTAKDSIHYARIKGTKLAEEHELLAKKLRPADDKMFKGFNRIKKMPEGDEKKAYITQVLAGLDDYSVFKRKTIHQFAMDHPSSYVSLYYLDKNALSAIANYETTYPFYEQLSKELKATDLGKQLGERLLAVKGKLTDQPYKDFVSTTPDGKQLSLKEVIAENKYTLVDFWASWCGPCRKENPNVVKAYHAFKDKGFTILSVSLDDDATKWKNAIEEDGMPWYHVSSLMGWKEPAAALYGIRAIPQNILVDSQGKIVATNLKAETLYNKIEELILQGE